MYLTSNEKTALGAGCLIVIVLMLVGTFLGGLIVWALWNWLAVSLFSAQPITYWVGVGIAFALSFISSIFQTKITVNRG